MKRSTQFVTGAVIGVTSAMLAGASMAQEWPRARPITITVAFAPGATTDIVARLIAPKVGEALGTSVVIDNKPGAGGNIAAQQVKRMAPDGYSLLGVSVAFAVNPSLYANAGYDAQKDFIGVIQAASTPNAIAVNPSIKANNIRELIELAKKEKLAYASSGIGTTTHLSVERIKTAAGVDITHVPYQPSSAVGAAVAGHTAISSTSLPQVVTHSKAGRLRVLAVTSAQRSPVLPDVPTMNESGFSNFDDLTWFAFLAPAGTPQAIVDRLNAEMNKALQAPDVREKMEAQGLTSRQNTAAEFAAFLREEIPKWAKAVKDSGAKAD